MTTTTNERKPHQETNFTQRCSAVGVIICVHATVSKRLTGHSLTQSVVWWSLLYVG